MPEGPEVKTVVDSLNATLKNAQVIKVEQLPTSRYYNIWIKDKKPQVPFIIKEVKSKGKHIFFHLNNGYLHSHLIMTGKWLWTEGKYTRIKFHLNDGRVLYYDDQRRWGHLDWMNQTQYEAKLKTIGIDLLSEKIGLTQWKKIMRNKRLKKNKQICDLLMSQKYISGIGNYLKAEILYRAKIKPNRTLIDLTEKELEDLYQISLETIKASYESKGLTIATYETPDGQRGCFELMVYNQKVDPLGNEVVKETFQDGRVTHWVPAVQK